MDLRDYRLNDSQIGLAAEVLNYQPFIISDDVQTGVAYSWFHSSNPRVAPPLVFRRSEPEWEKAAESNQRLREMYDRCIEAIATRYPNGTLFDIACNNGYFAVRAEMMGMAPSCGMDAGPQYGESIAFLNSICGTRAKFIHATYDPVTHSAPVKGRYDVVVASAIMCHLPDPTHFLAFLGSIAKEAIFFWGQVIDTDTAIVAYDPPHEALDLRHGATPFPHCFNDNTRMSRGLMKLCFKLMGFTDITYITTDLLADARIVDLEAEIARGSRHVAVLARRPR